jgi:hypothetical protein
MKLNNDESREPSLEKTKESVTNLPDRFRIGFLFGWVPEYFPSTKTYQSSHPEVDTVGLRSFGG